MNNLTQIPEKIYISRQAYVTVEYTDDDSLWGKYTPEKIFLPKDPKHETEKWCHLFEAIVRISDSIVTQAFNKFNKDFLPDSSDALTQSRGNALLNILGFTGLLNMDFGAFIEAFDQAMTEQFDDNLKAIQKGYEDGIVSEEQYTYLMSVLSPLEPVINKEE